MNTSALSKLEALLPDLIDLIGEEAAFDIAKSVLASRRLTPWPNPVVHGYLNKTRQYHVLRQIFEAAVAQGAYPPPSQIELQRRAIEIGRPSALVTTLPKSGTLFLGNILVQKLGCPNLQVSMGRFPNNFMYPAVLRILSQGGAMAIDHIDACRRNLDDIAAAGIKKILVHVRDPRQATVSWARYVDSAQTGRRHLDRYYNDPALPADYDTWPQQQRLDWQCANHFPAAVRWITQWLAVANSDPRFDIAFTEYQMLRTDPDGLVCAIAGHFGFEKLSPGVIPEPIPGVDNFRSGLSDEWRDEIDSSSLEWMNSLLPEPICHKFGWQVPSRIYAGPPSTIVQP